MNETPLISQIDALLRDEIVRARVAPAAVAGFAVRAPSGHFTLVAGACGTLPGGLQAGESTLFDLASVSKPIVACTLARLAARGRLSLVSPLSSLLHEAVATPSADVPLELLLAHRAGLASHRALFEPLFSGRPFLRSAALREAASARRPECADAVPQAGFEPLYSDLGYLLLGAALERTVGQPLDQLIDEEISAPLGLELGSSRLLRRSRASFAVDVAPTESVRARGGSVRGVVHDENSWALSGHGASGHAGLFGSVLAVLGFGAALLEACAGKSGWLSQTALEPLTRPRPGGSLRAGFDGKSPGFSSAGALASAETFGHLGFTGTSLWCDPLAEIVTVLLSNRVCPTRDNPSIRLARPRVHDALYSQALSVQKAGPHALPGAACGPELPRPPDP